MVVLGMGLITTSICDFLVVVNMIIIYLFIYLFCLNLFHYGLLFFLDDLFFLTCYDFKITFSSSLSFQSLVWFWHIKHVFATCFLLLIYCDCFSLPCCELEGNNSAPFTQASYLQLTSYLYISLSLSLTHTHTHTHAY